MQTTKDTPTLLKKRKIEYRLINPLSHHRVRAQSLRAEAATCHPMLPSVVALLTPVAIGCLSIVTGETFIFSLFVSGIFP